MYCTVHISTLSTTAFDQLTAKAPSFVAPKNILLQKSLALLLLHIIISFIHSFIPPLVFLILV